MTITFTTRHMDVTAPLKEYAENKASKLDKYYDRILTVDVVLEANKDSMRAEFKVHADHNHLFVAQHEDSDAYAAIDGSVHKIERQLTEHKQMVRNRKHPEQ